MRKLALTVSALPPALAEWPLDLTDGGRRAASGVYFARITADDGPSSIVKFAIER